MVRRMIFRMTGGRAEARPYIWYVVSEGVWRGRWCGNGQKRDDVRPFGLALRKIAKNLWKGRPGAESPSDGARIIFSLEPVCATPWYFAVPADGVAPVFQEFTVFQPQVQRKGLESGSPDGVTPTREELRDVMLGDS